MIYFLENYSLLIFLFFIISTLYSSVGFGGGSSYLAVLALTGLTFTQIRSTALLCNIVVVSSNVYIYHKQKNVNFKELAPLVMLSIPMAYLGGKLKITQEIFLTLLGFTLLAAAISMWFSKPIHTSENKMIKNQIKKNTVIGGFIGFISGLVGIGGGIFLSPLLHLTNWNTPKRIATASSFFILVNSLAGFLGQISNNTFFIDWTLTTILLITVFIGGQLGNRCSHYFLNANQLKKMTAILIVFVSLKILLDFF